MRPSLLSGLWQAGMPASSLEQVSEAMDTGFASWAAAAANGKTGAAIAAPVPLESEGRLVTSG